MNVQKYLERIGFSSDTAPSAQSLADLQVAHLYSVPYENMDILWNRPISLQAEDLYRKIVENRRGGFCFELNELFGQLLRALGYGVTDLFGRFLKGETGIPMRRHHVLIVDVPGQSERYVCDVGVGTGSPTWPLKLIESIEQPQQDGNLYRFTKHEFYGWVLEEKKRGEWGPIYSFTMEKQAPIDFVAASFWCEKSPDSPFNKEEGVYLRKPFGRLTQEGNAFRRFSAEGVSEEIISDPAEKEKRLREWFGIEK